MQKVVGCRSRADRTTPSSRAPACRAPDRRVGRRTAIGSSGRPCATAPSSTTRSRARGPSRRAGPRCRRPAATGSSGAATTRSSVSRSGRSRGSSSSSCPTCALCQARRKDGSFAVEPERAPPPQLALIGARSCDLHAIAVQDRTLLDGPYVDATTPRGGEACSSSRVNCGQAGGTCFCVSMETGPRADAGLRPRADRAARRRATASSSRSGTERGADVLARLPQPRRARGRPRERPTTSSSDGRARWGARSTPTGIKELLYRNLEHPRWDDVAERCLACTNCTLVCPTCFCTTVEDTTDLDGRDRRAVAALGLVLHARPLVRARRQRAARRSVRATASGSPTSWRAGSTSSAPRAASAAAAASPGARSASTSPRRSRPSARVRASDRDSPEGAAGARVPQGPLSEQTAIIVGCAKNARFQPGEFLLREGAAATTFFLLRSGEVALELHVPGRGPVQMEKLGPGDVIGLSWIYPPHRVALDARAIGPVVALAFAGAPGLRARQTRRELRAHQDRR